MSGEHGPSFGRYVLLEELARGGMGRVYRALLRGGPGFSKQVAIKRLLREVSDDSDFVARFADEARIACSLNHANIVQVFDFGDVDGEHYLTMELVDGVDLGSLIDEVRKHNETIPVPAALYIAAGFCRGLGAAHQRLAADGSPCPVVHRDVSPHNVLVSRAGDVKVTDFGIATAAERVMRTRTGLVIGKCRYLSPEQARGVPVDARADVFASGCVLFEALTGQSLFSGETPAEVLHALASDPVPRIRSVCSAAPPTVVELLTRAVQRERGDRYADGADMGREIEKSLREIAPGFCQDDLAALVQRWFPAPTRKSSDSRSEGPLGPWDSRSEGPLGPWDSRSEGPLGPWDSRSGDGGGGTRPTDEGTAPTLPGMQPGQVPPTAPTQPSGPPSAALHAAESNAAGADGSAPTSDPVIAFHAAPTQDLERAPPANSPQPEDLSADRPPGEPRTASLLRAPGGPRGGAGTWARIALIGVALALAGALVGGALARRFSRTAAAPPWATIQIEQNRPVPLGAWTVQLLKLDVVSAPRKRGRRLALHIRLRRSNLVHVPTDVGRRFLLRVDAGALTPSIFWHVKDNQDIVLVFSFPNTPSPARAQLYVNPPGQRGPVLLELPAWDGHEADREQEG